MKKISVPVALLLVLVFVGLVSAVIYWAGTQRLSQTIKEVAGGSVKTATIRLDNIDEGDTATYDNETIHDFEKALTINVATVSTGGTRSLSATFDNAPDILHLYNSYQLTLIADNVPAGSTAWTTGDTVLTVNLSTTENSVELDNVGTWTFDYEVTVTAKNVTADTDTNAKFTFEVT